MKASLWLLIGKYRRTCTQSPVMPEHAHLSYDILTNLASTAKKMPVVVRTFFFVLSHGQNFLEEEGFFFIIVSAMMISPLPVTEEICPASFPPPLFFL